MRKRRHCRWLWLIICVGPLTSLCGCHFYQFGSPSLHRLDIQSVHVAMFESDSYRRFLGQRLTEAVVKEIELNTPLRVTTADTAQSFVRGRIIRDQKRVLAENAFDDPRVIQMSLRVEVDWVDRAGIPLMERQVLRVDDEVAFIPEGGQNMMTTQQELINKIARQIVNQMEAPW